MSGDYASRLKEYHHKGVCGLPEKTETKRALAGKVDQLVQLWKTAQTVVILTGAGISTAAGIPDFRGPKGVWTLEEKEKKAAKSRKRRRGQNDKKIDTKTDPPVMQFNKAKPTLTHRALYYLWKKGRLDLLITQNVDGLHRRSGLPRSVLAILHGCVFTEKCESCGYEYFRDEEVPGISFQRTGQFCSQCQSHLRDTLLDWCDHLPEDDWDRCQDVCDQADLIITLGTSLRMEPAASLVRRGKRYVVVNLQETPYDEEAALVIRHKVDELLHMVLTRLGYPDDWEKEYPTPDIERQSPPVDPKLGNKWWQSPVDDEEEEEVED